MLRSARMKPFAVQLNSAQDNGARPDRTRFTQVAAIPSRSPVQPCPQFYTAATRAAANVAPATSATRSMSCVRA